MFSEALYILDKNTERLMVDELQSENQSLKSEKQALEEKNQSLETENQSIREKLSAYEARFGSI